MAQKQFSLRLVVLFILAFSSSFATHDSDISLPLITDQKPVSIDQANEIITLSSDSFPEQCERIFRLRHPLSCYLQRSPLHVIVHNIIQHANFYRRAFHVAFLGLDEANIFDEVSHEHIDSCERKLLQMLRLQPTTSTRSIELMNLVAQIENNLSDYGANLEGAICSRLLGFSVTSSYSKSYTKLQFLNELLSVQFRLLNPLSIVDFATGGAVKSNPLRNRINQCVSDYWAQFIKITNPHGVQKRAAWNRLRQLDIAQHTLTSVEAANIADFVAKARSCDDMFRLGSTM